jgi:hypothetical protein
MKAYLLLVSFFTTLHSCKNVDQTAVYSFDAGKHQVSYALSNVLSANTDVAYSDYNSDIINFIEYKFLGSKEDTCLLLVKQTISNTVLCSKTDSAIFKGQHFVLSSIGKEHESIFDSLIISNETKLFLSKKGSSFVLSACFANYSYFTMQAECNDDVTINKIINSVYIRVR